MLRKDAKIELLKRVPLFAECSKRELRELATVADEIDFPEGRVLAKEDSPGREFFVVVRGTVRVTRKGRKLADLGEGDWFGEMALLTDEPRVATVKATSDVDTLVIHDRGFRRIIRTMPTIELKVLRCMAVRISRNAQS